MTNPVTKMKSSLVAREPVIAAAAASWVLLQVGAVIVGRTHLLTDSEWTPLSSAVAPVLTGVVVAVIGLLVRRVVTPVEKAYAEFADWLDGKGLLVPGDHAAPVLTRGTGNTVAAPIAVTTAPPESIVVELADAATTPTA